MKERSVYSALISGAFTEGWALHRLRDDSSGRKPCDIVGAAPDGRAVALEIKVVRLVRECTHIPWRQFAPHQQAWLRAYCARNAYALVGLWEENYPAMKIYRLDRGLLDAPLGELVQVTLTKQSDAFWGWHGLLRS